MKSSANSPTISTPLDTEFVISSRAKELLIWHHTILSLHEMAQLIMIILSLTVC